MKRPKNRIGKKEYKTPWRNNAISDDRLKDILSQHSLIRCKAQFNCLFTQCKERWNVRACIVEIVRGTEIWTNQYTWIYNSTSWLYHHHEGRRYSITDTLCSIVIRTEIYTNQYTWIKRSVLVPSITITTKDKSESRGRFLRGLPSGFPHEWWHPAKTPAFVVVDYKCDAFDTTFTLLTTDVC